jgi:uncharacterized membrane protein
MLTRSEPRRTSPRRERQPIFARVGQRRRSLAAMAILWLTAAALLAVLVVILANL